MITFHSKPNYLPMVLAIGAIFLLAAVPVLAAPSISGVSGTLNESSTVTISGSGFGVNALDIEWLGGPSGNIESGSIGSKFDKSDWSRVSDTEPFIPPVYTNVDKYSGSKSILARLTDDPDGDGVYGNYYSSTIRYNLGSLTTNPVYMTYWVKADEATDYEGGQWKIWRFMYRSNVKDSDTSICSNTMFASFGPQYTCNTGTSFFTWGSPGDDDSISDSGKLKANTELSPSIKRQRWLRLEIWADPDDTAGSYSYGYYDEVDRKYYTLKSDTNIHIRPIQYVFFQNYRGNLSASYAGGCGSGDAHEHTNIYMDDIYISDGSQARVELCSGSTWGSRGICEIQPPTVWNSIEVRIKLNPGGTFKSGDTAYLYVIDSDGNVNSAGKSVKIGDTSVCVSDCSGRVCGDNGCGTGSCGTCPSGETCDAGGQCVADPVNSPTDCPSQKFQAGDRVSANTTTNVRSGPGPSQEWLGTRTPGDLGTVTGPSQYIDPAYCYAPIDYDTGVDGWSHENMLDLFTNQPSGSGDLNADNTVDVIDLGILLSNWGAATRPTSDINQDGHVDVIDLGILLGNWG